MSEPTGRPVARLELPADPEALDTAHDALDAAWSEHPDVGAGERLRFVTALMEILGNVVEHAYAADARAHERRLTVEVDGDGDGGLHGRIEDNGQPAALDLSDVAMPDADAESGRGLALAVAALDDLSYERVGSRNVWTLRCERRP
ncbi:ATP-binding protein [Nocardioides zeae]|uniref:Serine/threonine-protein kinase RsbW n=1 Tax=Nocardioides zeae TaxID=1457234 RepID=A0AAJ1TY99_9ACTN|nr:ATP-binding protein [Nocardioides zeae]MDQ1103994.1 serine/threonine-protein kinase RsbW [Nocardioides zeae]